jgi:hypothetical protein
MHDAAAGQDIVLPAFYWGGLYHHTPPGMVVEDKIFKSRELDDYLASTSNRTPASVLTFYNLFIARPKHGNCSVLRMAGSLLGHPLNPAQRKIPWYQSGQNNLLVLVPHEHMHRFDRLQEALGPRVVQRSSFSWMEPAEEDWDKKQAVALQKDAAKPITGVNPLGGEVMLHCLNVHQHTSHTGTHAPARTHTCGS